MQRPCAAEWGHIDEYFDPRDKQRHAFSDHSIQIDGGTNRGEGIHKTLCNWVTLNSFKIKYHSMIIGDFNHWIADTSNVISLVERTVHWWKELKWPRLLYMFWLLNRYLAEFPRISCYGVLKFVPFFSLYPHLWFSVSKAVVYIRSKNFIDSHFITSKIFAQDVFFSFQRHLNTYIKVSSVFNRFLMNFGILCKQFGTVTQCSVNPTVPVLLTAKLS